MKPTPSPPTSVGFDTIGHAVDSSATAWVRVPAHATALALVAGLGAPVTAPSANPPRPLAAARAYFGDAVAVYVDGGPLPGVASTVAVFDLVGTPAGRVSR